MGEYGTLEAVVLVQRARCTTAGVGLGANHLHAGGQEIPHFISLPPPPSWRLRIIGQANKKVRATVQRFRKTPQAAVEKAA